MNHARSALESLIERGNRHLFRYRDGRTFEGWLLEIRDDGVLVAEAGPLAPAEPYVVSFSSVDPTTLRYVEDGRLHRL